ncbi:SH3 domain-containing protein [Desulfuromonas acetoxidans]|uniref:SH3, type 3 n=1 Tax=Desulfuromonas acetoxidans (strain DSM 684 / 11070) TaxID=281689 RepID=Q1K2Z2_DESA6|nr:SH3 domain-containing protein [Desulfuromonas acetoxidans]EAT16739.1 SH3, type 3 [Desulfuromonas acetoxidans DSM 684]NVD23679.1 SH3 domain-containing protein [Desulfuromonas acetoxidans]NVE15936.1 SH3 domain-containing protein [Desulfuromonas acetoxidans]
MIKIPKTCSLQSTLNALDETRAAQRATDAMELTNSYRFMMDALAPTRSLQTITDAMELTNSYRSMLDTLTPTGSLQTITDAMELTNSYRSMLDTLTPTRSLQTITDAMELTNSYRSTLDTLTPKGTLQAITDAIRGNNYYQAATNYLIQDIGKSTLHDLNESITLKSSIEGILKKDYLVTITSFLQDNNLPSYENVYPSYTKQEIEDVLNEISSSKNIDSLNNKLNNTNTRAVAILLALLIHFIIPQINNIFYDIAKNVSNDIKSEKTTKRDKLNEIDRAISASGIRTDTLRIVTVNNLRLRASPNKNSSIINKLQLGQLVMVISKKKNWIEIQYTCSDTEIYQGWVFTRYTTRLKK